MSKIKEVFAIYQQEQDDFEKHYSDLYRIAKDMGALEDYKELYKATFQNNNRLTKTKTNVRKKRN